MRDQFNRMRQTCTKLRKGQNQVSLTSAGIIKCVFMFLGDIGFVGRPGSPGEDAFGEF